MAKKIENTAFTFQVQEKIAIVGGSPNGWSLMVNRIAWNGVDPGDKMDIRWWDPMMEHCKKGLVLREAEARNLMTALQTYFAEE